MRTTVTLDPDVDRLLRRAMRTSGAPFKQVLNDAVRIGLQDQSAPLKPTKRPRRVHLPVAHMGAALVNVTKALALSAQLEDEAIIAKLRAGK